MTSSDKLQIQRFQQSLNEALVLDGKISQRELCKRLDITIGTMTKYLRGEVNPFDVKTRITMNLAAELKMTPESLYNFFKTGKYGNGVDIDAVESWIRSSAGQADFPRILNSLAFSQNKSLELASVTSIDNSKVRFTDEGAKAFLRCVRENIQQTSDELGITYEAALSDLIPIITKNFKPNYVVYAMRAISKDDKDYVDTYKGEMLYDCWKAHEWSCPLCTSLKEWSGKSYKAVEKTLADAQVISPRMY